MSHTPDNISFINGEWVSGAGAQTIPVISPASENVIAVVQSATSCDVDDACSSAASAMPAWSSRSVAERADLVLRLASEIAAHAESFATLITAEMGTPIRDSRTLQVGAAVRLLRRTAEIGRDLAMAETLDSSKVLRVPIGVVACITPWNYPLFQIASKVAPALVAGCSVVLKPSEIAPGSAALLAELTRKVGFPVGVFNMVMGTGAVVGERLVANPFIDAISFTGSTQAGKRIAEHAGAGLKRVSLELGGKSPSVILPDADAELAVERTIAKCFQNAGQTCAALTRLIVPAHMRDRIAAAAVAIAGQYRLGDPALEDTTMGPVATSTQRHRIRTLLDHAVVEGAELLLGGPTSPESHLRGFFVRPTVLIANDEMQIAREEIFGPVLTILAYENEQEALQLAQSGDYGLSGAIWSRDLPHAVEFAKRIRSGSISINGAPTHPDAPFGGFRSSGFGRERGRYGIEEFLTTQAIHL